MKITLKGMKEKQQKLNFASSNIDIELIKENIKYSDFQDLLNNYSFYHDGFNWR